eukprot:scaffold4473_cov421-Prasinococcus_capsulatus_cf.AAC.7
MAFDDLPVLAIDTNRYFSNGGLQSAEMAYGRLLGQNLEQLRQLHCYLELRKGLARVSPCAEALRDSSLNTH